MPKRKATAADLGVPRRSKRLATKERTEQDQQNKGPEYNARKNEERKYPKASLLGIPGELRNRIYRYALVKSEPIKVTSIPITHQYPSLITVSRQIFNETVDIFLEENQFDVAVVDYEPRVPRNTMHWLKQVSVIGLIFIGQRKPWANLKEWVRKWHAGNYGYLDAGIDIDSQPLGNGSTDLKMVARAFQIVAPIKELPWSKVEVVLEKFKTATGEAGFVWD